MSISPVVVRIHGDMYEVLSIMSVVYLMLTSQITSPPQVCLLFC